MKKFTKGCLIAALVIFIIGCAFYGVFGVLGGFRELEPISDSMIFRLRDLPFGHYGLWSKIWDEDTWDFDDWTEVYDAPTSSSTSEAVQTKYSSGDITEISIELGGESLVIAESEDDYIWVDNESSNKNIKYGASGGEFKLYGLRSVNLQKPVTIPKGKIYLYLPKGMALYSIDMEVGAGKLESTALEADSISLEIGAGEFKIDSLTANEAEISVGAGNADIKNISANEADIEVGAGSLSIKGIDVGTISLDVGMGNVDVKGKINGNADIDCGMGNVNIGLEGNENDYNYELECAVGNINIGNNKYSGLASEKKIYNNSRQTFEIECAMGNIDIDFIN